MQVHPDELSLADIKTFATKLEDISVDSPASRIHLWGLPDSKNAEEIGNSGINSFPPHALTAPTSEEETIDIVKKAYASRSQVRVVGAAHASPRNDILTKYCSVFIDKDKNLAVANLAGTNLDIDLEFSDSTQTNSLVFQLKTVGFALPETSGLTHQKKWRFSGDGIYWRSLLYSFHDVVYASILIDGTGTKYLFSRDDLDPTLFFATDVSAGLCGIITDIALVYLQLR